MNPKVKHDKTLSGINSFETEVFKVPKNRALGNSPRNPCSVLRTHDERPEHRAAGAGGTKQKCIEVQRNGRLAPKPSSTFYSVSCSTPQLCLYYWSTCADSRQGLARETSLFTYHASPRHYHETCVEASRKCRALFSVQVLFFCFLVTVLPRKYGHREWDWKIAGSTEDAEESRHPAEDR